MTFEKRDAGNDGDVVLFNEFIDNLIGHFRLELTVFAQDRHWDAAERAAILLNNEHERVIHVLPERAGRS